MPALSDMHCTLYFVYLIEDGVAVNSVNSLHYCIILNVCLLCKHKKLAASQSSFQLGAS